MQVKKLFTVMRTKCADELRGDFTKEYNLVAEAAAFHAVLLGKKVVTGQKSDEWKALVCAKIAAKRELAELSADEFRNLVCDFVWDKFAKRDEHTSSTSLGWAVVVVRLSFARLFPRGINGPQKGNQK